MTCRARQPAWVVSCTGDSPLCRLGERRRHDSGVSPLSKYKTICSRRVPDPGGIGGLLHAIGKFGVPVAVRDDDVGVGTPAVDVTIPLPNIGRIGHGLVNKHISPGIPRTGNASAGVI